MSERQSGSPSGNSVSQRDQLNADPLSNDGNDPITGQDVNLNVVALQTPQQQLSPNVQAHSANTSGGISSILPSQPLQALFQVSNSLYQAMVDNGSINPLDFQPQPTLNVAVGSGIEVTDSTQNAGGKNAASGAIPKTPQRSQQAILLRE
jgi:hypothetical protein